MSDTSANNKRIAKNTILLYFRTILLMLITLYTSRVILDQLGVEDYGIYNVIGGVVAMFSVISSSLSSAISRFITFELGKGDMRQLRVIFSTSINIQVAISLIILFIGEIVGVWFLKYKMSIPIERLTAANWVLQCSLITFCINLISVPYNALIIAHERMSAFAYISILEALLKLGICYILTASAFDKLITYAILMVVVSLIVRLIYGVYCGRNFKESHYLWVHKKNIIREMSKFAGWSFVSNTAWIFNTQGINILVNLFFGVALNAARGIASQVEGAVMMFVRNFATALNPQITKYYASDNLQDMYSLMCRGTKFTLYLTLIMLLPLILETEYILQLWLKQVPPYTAIFVRLALIGSAINNIGNTCFTACQAKGDMKKFSLVVTSIGFLVFPLTWLVFKIGFPAESMYIVYIIVYSAVSIACMLLTRHLVKLPMSMFLHKALLPSAFITILASIIPIFVYTQMEMGSPRFFVSCITSIISCLLVIYLVGLTTGERVIVKQYIRKTIFKLNNYANK